MSPFPARIGNAPFTNCVKDSRRRSSTVISHAPFPSPVSGIARGRITLARPPSCPWWDSSLDWETDTEKTFCATGGMETPSTLISIACFSKERLSKYPRMYHSGITIQMLRNSGNIGFLGLPLSMNRRKRRASCESLWRLLRIRPIR